MRSDGETDVPAERMLSAYHTPVPETSTLDTIRCAESVPTVRTEANAVIARERSLPSRVILRVRGPDTRGSDRRDEASGPHRDDRAARVEFIRARRCERIRHPAFAIDDERVLVPPALERDRNSP